MFVSILAATLASVHACNVGTPVAVETPCAHRGDQWTSSACSFNAPSGITASVSSCVAASTTGAATPAANASRQVAAHTHHRSPGWRPGKPNSGAGVMRSLPRRRHAGRGPRDRYCNNRRDRSRYAASPSTAPACRLARFDLCLPFAVQVYANRCDIVNLAMTRNGEAFFALRD